MEYLYFDFIENIKANAINIVKISIYILAIVLILYNYKTIKKFLMSIANIFLKRLMNNYPSLASFISSIVNLSLDLLIIILIFKLIGLDLVDISILIASISAFIGFAFQGVLANFFGGMVILSFKPFVLGDVIEYENTCGHVQKIELYYTTIKTYNNELVLIPNGLLIKNRLRNLNVLDVRRLDLKIGVSYSSNIGHVKRVLNEIVSKRDDLFDLSMDNKIGLYEIAASTLDFELKMYVKPGKYALARFYIYESIKTVFEKENIQIPHDIIDLRVDKNLNKLIVKEKN